MDQTPVTRFERGKVSLLLVVALLMSIVMGTLVLGPHAPSLLRVAAQDGGTPDEIVTEWNGAGGNNVVNIQNRADGKRQIKSKIQLNRITAGTAAPVNSAQAVASCTGCQTIAVALQINLISTSASRVTPQNTALAVNYRCNGCITVAVALQYVISVDDPNQVPKDVDELIRAMERELRAASRDKTASLPTVVQRINGVLDQFRSLAHDLIDQRDEATEPTSPEATPQNFATPEGASPIASPVGSPLAPADSTEPTTASDQGNGTTGSGSDVAPTEAPAQETATVTPTPTGQPADAGTPAT